MTPLTLPVTPRILGIALLTVMFPLIATVPDEHLLAPKAPPPGSGEEEELQGYTFLGIAGGGTIVTVSGDARFSIFATQVTDGEDADPVAVIGQIRWFATTHDGASLTLESRTVDAYGWIDGVDGGRWARGTMAINGEGNVPFVMRGVDGGLPGAGADTIELLVGSAVEGEPATGFGYHAEGSLTSGDLSLIELPGEEGAPGGATPIT